ncbi:MAG TPA: hypothetical protein VES40_18270 [Ilumatobacteraceae bacterium]|nr:hypothetical protein [Ilumatobacteraceae bacterium]
MTPRSACAAAAFSAIVVLAGCGGSDGESGSGSTVADGTSNVTLAEAPTSEPAPESTSAPEPTAAASTVAGADGDCPVGTWQVDGAGLEPFYAVAAPPDVVFTPSGRFVIEIGADTYAATAEGFSLEMAISGGVTMVADVSGAVTGTVVDTGSTIEFVETMFDLDADVTMDGAVMPNDTVLGAFRETFGTGSRPYVCEGSTMTVTYDTPSGPAVVVFTPA